MGTDVQHWRKQIDEAHQRIGDFVNKTSVTLIENEPRAGSAKGFLKDEHLQKTGSFKLRGASNRVFSLSPEEAACGVMASSTGNHGLAVAAAAQHRRVDAEVYVCSQVSPRKLGLIEQYGARVVTVGDTPLEAELAARAAAAERGKTYISPYNDALVVAGQGTIAREIVEQLGEVDAIYVVVGGGGLIGGMGAYIKSVSPKTEVVACWPANAPAMYECLRAGKIIDVAEEPTLSQSTAGGVEPGSITFALCQSVIDRSVLVTEKEILEWMRWAHARGWAVEGAAAVAIAAFFKDAPQLSGKTAVIVSCGGNTSPEVMKKL
ncbi:MAG TPA: threonine/serine dehydratase [Terriglobales bacterium]|jgi:threonine dehydratase|nr:threonine/serine dehydratase [Terriglobales bacterium]